MTAITRPNMAVHRRSTEAETFSHLATSTSISPPDTQAVIASTTPMAYMSSSCVGSSPRRLVSVSNRKGGLHTRSTPERRRPPAQILTMLSLSLSIRAERMMVTTGQANMMHSASGTSMKETQASPQMKATEPVTPENDQRIATFQSTLDLSRWVVT